MIRYLIIAAVVLIAIPIAVQTFSSTPLVAASSVVGRRQGRCRDPLFGADTRDGNVRCPPLNDQRNYIDRSGFKLIRYPFKPDPMTPERIAELRTLTNYARSKYVPMILDAHTYKWPPPVEMAAFWTSFARNFPDDGSVMSDLVNEPRGFDDPVLINNWDQWLRDSNLVIAGLRANGIKHPILLEYRQWSATYRFVEGERKTAVYTPPCESAACLIDRGGGLNDPLRLTYINAHRYFDQSSSGTNAVCSTEVSGFSTFVEQLRRRGLKAYLTESAFGSSYGVDPSCKVVAKEAIAALRANSDVILGVTWWGRGRIWPENYISKIEPPNAERFSASIPTYIKTL